MQKNRGPVKKAVRPLQKVVEPTEEVQPDEETSEPEESGSVELSTELMSVPQMSITAAQSGFAVQVTDGRLMPVVLWFLIDGKVVPGIADESATIVPATNYLALKTPQGSTYQRSQN